MSVIVASLQGRFGNQCMTYLFCRALAELCGKELRIEPWVGERVFQIEHPRPDGRPLRRVNEIAALGPFKWDEDIEVRGYAQMAACMIYPKRQAQSWLKLRPEIEDACNTIKIGVENNGPIDIVVCHRRVGDYHGYSYPIVSARSYHFAMAAFGLDLDQYVMLTEENPTNHAGLPDDLSFLPDFYRMMRAPTLLRGNSSFSWLAALLGNGLVLSPVVDGLAGGVEHYCKFVAGNWPRFCNIEFVEDLHVAA